MLSINAFNTEALAPHKAKFDAEHAAFEQAKGKYYELEKSYYELVEQTNTSSQKAGELERARKAARVEAGGKITKEVIAIRQQHAETIIELEELEEAQQEIREGLDDQLPALNVLATSAFKARKELATAAASTLAERRAALIKELGQILAFELSAKEQGTPFDLYNWRRFGDDGGPVDPKDMAVNRVRQALLHVIENEGNATHLMAEIGVTEIEHGPLDVKLIGSPLGTVKRRRAQ